MLANYEASLKRVIVHEGGYVNHPKDPGGATMKGVTQRVYDAYRRRRQLPTQAVRGISAAEIADIYRTQYADKIRFDALPKGVDYVVFDGAVNSGPAQSVKWLQRALGVADDGVIGNVTMERAKNHPRPADLIRDICAQRMKFLKQLKTWKTFGKGWTNRVSDVERSGLAMLGSADPVASPSLPSPNSSEKAPASDLNKPAAPIGGPTAGAAGGTAAVVLETARQQLEPLAGAGSFVNQLLVYLTVAATLIALGGLAYGLYAKHRAKKVAEVAS